MLRTRWLTQKSIGCGKIATFAAYFAAEIGDVFLGILRRMASTPTRAGGATAACRSECVRLGAEATDPAPMCRSVRPRGASCGNGHWGGRVPSIVGGLRVGGWTMGLRRFLTFLEERSSRRSSFETTTCSVCSREVEREVTAYAGRTIPGTWWPPTDENVAPVARSMAARPTTRGRWR